MYDRDTLVTSASDGEPRYGAYLQTLDGEEEWKHALEHHFPTHPIHTFRDPVERPDLGLLMHPPPFYCVVVVLFSFLFFQDMKKLLVLQDRARGKPGLRDTRKKLKKAIQALVSAVSVGLCFWYQSFHLAGWDNNSATGIHEMSLCTT